MLELFNLEQLLTTFGYFALFAIVFAETGLLAGFFLPGDTLLFTAGLLASKGVLGIWEVLAVCTVAAILGDSAGYFLGKRFGKRVFERKNTDFLGDYLNNENLEKARKFYATHGDKTIFLARFAPIVRTLAPTLAGTAEMNYPTFLAYNVAGGVAWVFSMALAGYFLGGLFPQAVEIMSGIMILIILASLFPTFLKFLQGKKKKQ